MKQDNSKPFVIETISEKDFIKNQKKTSLWLILIFLSSLLFILLGGILFVTNSPIIMFAITYISWILAGNH